jgi:hypothetical protein
VSYRKLRMVVAIVIFVPTVLTGVARADGLFHGGRVFVAGRGCGGQSYRPKSIVLACADAGLYATDIRYRYYGGKTAQAAVQLHTHSCIPDCAESAFHAFPGTIILRDVVRCEGVLYYSRASYRFTGGAPYGERASGTADIEPFGEGFGRICGPVLG